MPYHEIALNRQWEELEKEVQILILALMRAVGGGFLATGIALFLLLFTYLRIEEKMIVWIIPVIALITSLGSLYATVLVKTKTAANPPVKLSILSLALIIVGAIAFFSIG